MSIVDDLNNLDPTDLGSWPVAAKALSIIIVLAVALFLGWYLAWNDSLKQLESATNKETDLRSTFVKKQKKAANLEAYEQQLAEMKETFGALLRQLPTKAEVAALLVDISQAGRASGLEFNSFTPGGERAKDGLIELPIKITVTGSYHEFGRFVSQLASMPRIVTIHNVSIKKDRGKADLSMDLLAKTFRYAEDSGE